MARYIMEMGSAVVSALSRLEARAIQYTAYNLRGLEQLLTPEARNEILIVLQSHNAKLPDIEKAFTKARHKMWAKFIWEAHPDIHEDKRMYFPLIVPTTHTI